LTLFFIDIHRYSSLVTDRAVGGNVVDSMTIDTGTHLQRLAGLGLHDFLAGNVAMADGARLGNVR
jgi:hypothetical protein